MFVTFQFLNLQLCLFYKTLVGNSILQTVKEIFKDIMSGFEKYVIDFFQNTVDASVTNTICDVHSTLKSQNSDSSEFDSSGFLYENKITNVTGSVPHFEKMDITFLNYPGVYEILDIENNKSYYGETTSLVRRMMQHNQGLVNETHECKALVAAFKKQGKQIDKFRFIVHKSGPQ